MKICKGVGKTKGFGCGVALRFCQVNGIKSYLSTYGLGHSCGCYKSWMTSGTEDANKALNKFAIKFKKKIISIDKKETGKKRVANLSNDGYRAKFLQPKINEIARLIDYGQNCIARQKLENPAHGGHYISVGASRTTALNLHNIHAQSIYSNKSNSGDSRHYRKGLIKRYGNEYFEFIEGLENTPLIKLSKKELIELHAKASMISKRLKKDLKIRSPKELIELRNSINKELGIYSVEYSVF